MAQPGLVSIMPYIRYYLLASWTAKAFKCFQNIILQCFLFSIVLLQACKLSDVQYDNKTVWRTVLTSLPDLWTASWSSSVLLFGILRLEGCAGRIPQMIVWSYTTDNKLLPWASGTTSLQMTMMAGIRTAVTTNCKLTCDTSQRWNELLTVRTLFWPELNGTFSVRCIAGSFRATKVGWGRCRLSGGGATAVVHDTAEIGCCCCWFFRAVTSIWVSGYSTKWRIRGSFDIDRTHACKRQNVAKKL